MKDQIRLKNLEVFAHHGVYPEEVSLGQKFLVDAVLYADIREAGCTDNLKASVDYESACHFIKKHMQEHTFKLLEAAAEHLAEAILLEFSRVESIELEIKKPRAPIALPLEAASVSIRREWHTVCLSVGSNLGDREGYIHGAKKSLDADRHIRDIKISSLIETEPYGNTDQPMFLNAAICLRTLYTPYELLDCLHRIEKEAGRKRGKHWAPRTLDLDILFYDDSIFEQAELIIPHPDMENRMFVLRPLAELCPGKVHPILRKTVLRMEQELEI